IDQDAGVMRHALERRNTWLDLDDWPRLWITEERARIGTDTLRNHVRDDLQRIEGWPFRSDPGLTFVYREAARILHDSALSVHMRARVERQAPRSLLACSLARANENPESSPSSGTAVDNSQEAFQQREQKAAAAAREQLRRCPADWPSLLRVWR